MTLSYTTKCVLIKRENGIKPYSGPSMNLLCSRLCLMGNKKGRNNLKKLVMHSGGRVILSQFYLLWNRVRKHAEEIWSVCLLLVVLSKWKRTPWGCLLWSIPLGHAWCVRCLWGSRVPWIMWSLLWRYLWEYEWCIIYTHVRFALYVLLLMLVPQSYW